MDESSSRPIAIVGGGPVGLFLACCLQHAGIDCVLLEQRAGPVTHSRSIGIHPVALERFAEIGLARAFTAEGVKVRRGRAYCNRRHVGTLSFDSCPPPYPFILTLPQHRTERLLTRHLQHHADGGTLQRGCRVTGMAQTQDPAGVHISYVNDSEDPATTHTLHASLVIGCDGKESMVRRWAAIPAETHAYDDTYIMGDFSDTTAFGSDAAIFLGDEGLIESFPLPGGLRRWVVKTASYLPEVTRADIEVRVARRTGHTLQGAENTMLSSFGVQKQLAHSMSSGRILLAGDAAHVVSPIGGQGMNLGWLDAWELTEMLRRPNSKKLQRKALVSYSKRRMKAARQAARRAEFNMALGRQTNALWVRRLLLSGLLNTPLSHVMGRIFTMRGLGRWPV